MARDVGDSGVHRSGRFCAGWVGFGDIILTTLRKPAGIVLSLLFLAALTAPLRFAAQQQPESPRTSRLLLIIPFENASTSAGIDWIGESVPEILNSRLNSSVLYVMSREDRLSAFDHLGIPATAKPSRATIYEVAQQLDADYVLMGSYRLESSGNLIINARLMDMARLRLGPEITESGPLAKLVSMETALAWDVLHSLDPAGHTGKADFMAKYPALRVEALENYVRGITANNEQEKIKRFQEAVRLEPSYTLAIWQLGKSYYQQRDYESAVTWLVKVPSSDANANQAQFYLGLAAYYAGHLDRSEAAFRNLASQLPLTEIYNNLGVISARRGEHAARGYFEKSIQTDPNEPDYHFNLALELSREADVQGAVRELKEVLAIHPDAEAKALLDSLSASAAPVKLPFGRMKRSYDESSFRQLALEIESANEARLSKSDPATHAAFHVQRGQELLEAGVPGEAEKEFREAVVLEPGNAAAHSGLARVLESNQDATGARNEARTSLKLKPSVEAYLVLARLDLSENKSAAAEQNVEHALALDPANAAAAALKHDIAGLAARPQSQQR
jgi:Tfp pilus assembly protein PilF/TolB-like protein